MPSRNIVHGRGVGSKSRIRVTRPGGRAAAAGRTRGNSTFYSKNENVKTHRVIANYVFFTKKDRLGSHRTIGN